ncbi:5-oxoprolinase subunit PxpB [Paenibacillus arenilitoris]|uniref:5-oxoprolinase subunit PxpB n=1 Tax=Paenibacillus arenilitoris TaxID=2772299 RepID=A0A927CSA2_9BACL|nr:5-oxoprolinase subunit PxpB [Paenibacillus arenilitoris]MBD2872697.1 5-oxoprolinase subunit PxpB [Paenibacillus arenilitoris]
MTNADRGWELLPLGDGALLIRFGDAIDEALNRTVHAFAARLEKEPFAGMIECVPAFASVAVHYEPLTVMRSRSQDEARHETVYETVYARVERVLDSFVAADAMEERTVIEIPVCYGDELGPDLAFVAAHCGLSEDEVIAIHSGGAYVVHMIGFAPGFPYLGGMSERIAAPRRQTPRTIIPAGSVGIAGKQTGVYPIATPGGWQLIGRTPLALFRPERAIPSLLHAGHEVRFKPISRSDYDRYGEGAR